MSEKALEPCKTSSTRAIGLKRNGIIKENKGIIEVVTDNDSSKLAKVHYLPHHPIIRKDKQTTKMRIVYDASARCNGPSLNDCLHAGPAFGQNVLDIIL